jgi:hypothetical protein
LSAFVPTPARRSPRLREALDFGARPLTFTQP